MKEGLLKENIDVIPMKIQFMKNGPILINRTCELEHSDGRVEVKEKTTALYRCGQSGNKPFCDGIHTKLK